MGVVQRNKMVPREPNKKENLDNKREYAQRRWVRHPDGAKIIHRREPTMDGIHETCVMELKEGRGIG